MTMMPRLFLILTFALLPAFASGADSFGRLFNTPEERAALDRLRENNGVADKAPAVEQIELNGVVKRSGGKFTAWINQKAQNENQNPQGILVLGKTLDPSSAALLLSSGKKVELKAGQTYDTVSGKVEDVTGQAAESGKAASKP